MRSHYNLPVLIEQDEDGYYVATVPALKSCYTQAKTIEELYPRIKEVIELCLEEEEPMITSESKSRYLYGTPKKDRVLA